MKRVTLVLALLLAARIFTLDLSHGPDPARISDGKFDETAKEGVFNKQKVYVPGYLSEYQLTENTASDVLGKNSKEKRIEVDLTNQKVYAYEGSKKKYSFTVSTGKWGATPKGDFRIWYKIKYTLMTGGSQALGTYYYLPNVPFTMFFHQGYGLHGAYWHDNFGHPMSHGCVNMKIADAEKLFYWAGPELPENASSVRSSDSNPGTKVIVYGDTPNE